MPIGYTYDEGIGCVDDDECAAESSTCGDHATCENLPGAHACVCAEGTIDTAGDGSVCIGVQQVVGGSAHTSGPCALPESGALYCWGSNTQGQLGNGTLTPRYSPTRVGSAADWTAISAGARAQLPPPPWHPCGRPLLLGWRRPRNPRRRRAHGERLAGAGRRRERLERGVARRQLLARAARRHPPWMGVQRGTESSARSPPPPPPPSSVTASAARSIPRCPLRGRLCDRLAQGAEDAGHRGGLVRHGCGTRGADGLCDCWGWNTSGQIGDRHRHHLAHRPHVAPRSPGLRRAAVGAGPSHDWTAVRRGRSQYAHHAAAARVLGATLSPPLTAGAGTGPPARRREHHRALGPRDLD